MNEIALANFYRALNNADRFPKEHELAEAAIAAKDELNALRSPSEPQASVREVLKGENMSLMRDYYQDKPVAAISYNPFTDSQLRTISHWLKCQKDYFEKLAKEHPNEIQYQGMASAASMIKDKWELEQFEKRLDNA